MDNDELQWLLDRAHISDTVLRYATAVDTHNWELFRSCFTDEIELSGFPVFGKEAQKVAIDTWAENVHKIVGGYKATQHMITNHVITINGDEATCVAYLQAQHFLPTRYGSNSYIMGGYYTFTLVRISDSWKICKFDLTITWTDGNSGLHSQAEKNLHN